MTGNAARRAVLERVALYHEAQLAILVEHVAAEVDRFRSGEASAFDVDQVVFQYSRAAKELWKFCNRADVEFAALLLDQDERFDWWERGAPKRR